MFRTSSGSNHLMGEECRTCVPNRFRQVSLNLPYRKPGAKVPVIHPLDEAPFLVWGGEGSALRCLTEAAYPAILGINVLV